MGQVCSVHNRWINVGKVESSNYDLLTSGMVLFIELEKTGGELAWG